MVAAPPQQGSQFNESRSNNKKRGIIMMMSADQCLKIELFRSNNNFVQNMVAAKSQYDKNILMIIAADRYLGKKNRTFGSNDDELYESQKITLAVWRMYLNAIMPTTNKHSTSKPKHAINPSINKIITTTFVKPSSIQPRGIVRNGLNEIQQAQSGTSKTMLTEEMVATFNKILREMNNNNNSC